MRGLPGPVKLLVFAAFLVVLCPAIAPLTSDESTNATDADAKVEKIINGLLPAAAVKGQPVPRMKYYNVPAVSPDTLRFWRRAAIFCKAPLKKSTSRVFSASSRFSCSISFLWAAACVLGRDASSPG